MANSLSFGGIDLGGENYGLTVVESPIHVAGEPKLTETNLPGKHGAIINGKFLAPRIINVPCVVEGLNYDDLIDKLERIRAAFDPGLGEQDIIFDHLSRRKYVGRLRTSALGDPSANRAVETMLSFICSDPLAYGVSEQTYTLDESASWDKTIDYDGSAPTLLVIKVFSGNNATDASILVENVTNGKSKQLDFSLGLDLYTRFDGIREIIEYSEDDNDWDSLMQFLNDPATDWPELKPKVVNTLDFTGVNIPGGATGYVKVSFTERWY